MNTLELEHSPKCRFRFVFRLLDSRMSRTSKEHTTLQSNHFQFHKKVTTQAEPGG